MLIIVVFLQSLMIYLKEMEINIMAIDSTFWVAVSFIIFFGGINIFKSSAKNK